MRLRRLNAHAPLTPHLLHIMTTDLCPFADAQDMASFRAMEGAEYEDDAISVAVSAKDEWFNSPLGYTMPNGNDAGDLHHSDNVELPCVLSKAVDELGLE